MERSKGIILIVAGLAAILIVWQFVLKPTEEPESLAGTSQKEVADETPDEPQQRGGSRNTTRNTREGGRRASTAEANNPLGGPPILTSASTDISGMKISIPNDVSEATLETLAAEYMEINRAVSMQGRGGRTGGRTGGRGGFGGGDMSGFGGRDMGGFGGMDMGGRGGMMGGDPTEMMNNMREMMGGDPTEIMEMMRGGRQ